MNQPEPAEPLFHYAYGKDHWQNLADHAKDDNLPFVDRNKYFKLLWVDDDPQLNGYSAIESMRYDGELLILASSKVSDPSYDYKFETHIKHLKELALSFCDLISDCDGFKVTRWKMIEIENIYDNTLDGIKVQFTITKST
ncbi:hypothetical protein [Flavobacterium sedimenticola]|uniref:Uncharacterized protein n=1 Tax=Flavobacterium sedimenticola TaxID=3043286 RepID=A0ABT6XML8_9FLAO|nr:hypothetical protein [Flavobacterium sedimenticola]MDI9256331.1 hypothetical protein [Flavobacterium sedimenticola]